MAKNIIQKNTFLVKLCSHSENIIINILLLKVHRRLEFHYYVMLYNIYQKEDTIWLAKIKMRPV